MKTNCKVARNRTFYDIFLNGEPPLKYAKLLQKSPAQIRCCETAKKKRAFSETKV